ncbi:unnamed protein product [marine sediment metagenome]|uniref:Uncharacterized protein n=1 Tax=marine sediment metagenome TaxID=412755 RepID=X0YGF8_9ZZZZ
MQYFTAVSLHVDHQIKEPIKVLPDLVDDIKKEYPDENVSLDGNIIVWGARNASTNFVVPTGGKSKTFFVDGKLPSMKKIP